MQGDPVGGARHVVQQIDRVHAHHDGFGAGDVSLHQHQMLLVFDGVGIDHSPPLATGRVLVRTLLHLAHQPLGQAAVGDQVGDGAEFQIVALAEGHQVGEARHGAVVVHDLADHRGGE